MADEQSGLSLEEGTEIVGSEQPVVDPPVADTEPEPEGTVEIPQGKVVPLGALQAERAQRKEAEKIAAAKEAELAALKPKAEEYDRSSQYLQQAKPYIEALRANPHLVELAKNPPPKTEPKGPLTQDKAEQYAKDFDLYDAAGKPDVDRAQRIAKFHAEQAQQAAQQAIQPFQQASAQQTANTYKQHILGLKDGNGNAAIDPKFLNQVWNNAPLELTSSAEGANMLYITALGLQAQAGGAPKHAQAPPLVTESIGGGKPGAETLSSVGEAFLRSSNMSRKDYETTRSSYKQGQNNSLE